MGCDLGSLLSPPSREIGVKESWREAGTELSIHSQSLIHSQSPKVTSIHPLILHVQGISPIHSGIQSQCLSDSERPEGQSEATKARERGPRDVE